MFLSWFSGDTFSCHTFPQSLRQISILRTLPFWKKQWNQMDRRERSMIKCCYNPLVIKCCSSLGLGLDPSTPPLRRCLESRGPFLHLITQWVPLQLYPFLAPSLCIDPSKLIPIPCSCVCFIHAVKLQSDRGCWTVPRFGKFVLNLLLLTPLTVSV